MYYEHDIRRAILRDPILHANLMHVSGDVEGFCGAIRSRFGRNGYTRAIMPESRNVAINIYNWWHEVGKTTTPEHRCGGSCPR